ncbi:MarR family transcriptional regulator [Saccharibacillus sp. CPCC 101409]|uniref:MarR family winged helix-turn-helix transcriptional regulator n=1 Tax=Saccharibacillus sp. CPCC 101409 TaxID=3058041 RepID=UPI002671EE4E|nr:MarR family transcriptional regulator [Saccharibacillus sp. CPCC 101409]MDO3410927.1 MarR family transcriptional regulator [Saccharibacillus sp. CPCC 101409]
MKPIQKPQDPLSRFSLAVFNMNGLLLRSGDRVTRSIDQSSARWQVLGRIGHGTPTVAHIARDMGLARQSVQRIADVLADEGLAVYREHPTDRRTKLIEITPKGTEVLNAIYERYAKWNRHVMSRLDPQQLKNIADALEEVERIIEKELNDFGSGKPGSDHTEEGDFL